MVSPEWNSWKVIAYTEIGLLLASRVGPRSDLPPSRVSPQWISELLEIRGVGASFGGDGGKKEEAAGLAPALRRSSLERAGLGRDLPGLVV